MSFRSSYRHERERDRDRERSHHRSGGGERLRNSYHSPPRSSRVLSSSSLRRYDDHHTSPREDYRASRRDELSGSASGGGKCFSSFYRERFGSHSPEDYRNLRISQFDRSLSKNEIRVLLEQEFRSMAPFEIKIVRNPEDDERLAYVNFERDNCAKTIRRTMISRLQRVLGRRLVLDPTGVIRDQEGKYIPDRYNRAVMAAERRSPPVSPHLARHRSYSHESLSRTQSPRRSAQSLTLDNAFSNLVQDDSVASRTLFVGNLPNDARESELRRVFDIYGQIDEIDIKTMAGNSCYSFILYRTVEEAVEARRCQHNKPIRPGSSRCQIGYGKTQTSSRLYVGGLGEWTSAEMLMREFDRYGAIEELEYDPGQPCAYIRFVDIDSACDACLRMKNFELKAGKFITVDFAKNVATRVSRKRGNNSNGSLDEDLTDARARSPTSAGYIATLEELREQFACTWKGFVTLKKVNYPMGFHRIFGKEHLLQDYLRDESGAALKLNITQRLKLDNNYYQEIIDMSPRELALMIAIDGTPSAERIVQYLQEKRAAGLVTLNDCTVNILPQSPISERLLNFFAPRISVIKASSTYMLIVLRKISYAPAITTENAGLNTHPPTKTLRLDTRTEPMEEVQKSTASYQLEPPPPLPSLRVKAEMDDDRLEQIHQERLKLRETFKRDASPALNPAPLPPDLNALINQENNNKKTQEINGFAMEDVMTTRGNCSEGRSARQHHNNDDARENDKDKETSQHHDEMHEVDEGTVAFEKFTNLFSNDNNNMSSDKEEGLEETNSGESGNSSDADPANIHLEE